MKSITFLSICLIFKMCDEVLPPQMIIKEHTTFHSLRVIQGNAKTEFRVVDAAEMIDKYADDIIVEDISQTKTK